MGECEIGYRSPKILPGQNIKRTAANLQSCIKTQQKSLC